MDGRRIYSAVRFFFQQGRGRAFGKPVNLAPIHLVAKSLNDVMSVLKRKHKMNKATDSEKDIETPGRDSKAGDASEADRAPGRSGSQPELPPDPQDRVSALEEQLSLEKDKYLRLFAEFDNFRKRTVRDRIELLRYSNEEVIAALLPVLDDFERARGAGQLSEGLELIYQKLVSILEQKGLKPMEAKGRDFDPDLHDALTQAPAGDPDDKNKVVEEVEKGYYLNDKVIRHAKVVVGS
jgi:molecular chaperone GrpE